MIPGDIASRIAEKYAHALATGALSLTETVAQRVTAPHSKIPCVVSFAPSLALKPERPKTNGPPKPRPDPFENPSDDLTVLPDLNGDGKYMLLLNKFPIIPEHSLIVTREYRLQTEALNAEDLTTAFNVISQLDSTSGPRHMAFYNCGKASGSSQDHKHLQLFKLPTGFVPFQETQLHEGTGAFTTAFAHFTFPVDENMTGERLVQIYVDLLGKARGATTSRDNPNSVPSHNVLLTSTFMCVVPRSTSKTSVSDSHGESHQLGINATGYLGLLLAKSRETFDALCNEPQLIDDALLQCAFREC